MNLILPSCFVLLSLVLSLVIVIFKPGIIPAQARKYAAATSFVYLSGTVLILIFAIVMPNLRMIFFVISELSILSVYIITMTAIIRITRQISDIMRDVEAGKIKRIEDEEQEEQDEENA